MDLVLTCVLCLAGTVPSADPGPWHVGPGVETPAPASGADLRLPDPSGIAGGDSRLPLAQHDHGSQDEGEDGSHEKGGHGAWMSTTMIVLMVSMMATVGIVMMSRGGVRAAPSGPAALALPAIAPAGFSTPGG